MFNRSTSWQCKVSERRVASSCIALSLLNTRALITNLFSFAHPLWIELSYVLLGSLENIINIAEITSSFLYPPFNIMLSNNFTVLANRFCLITLLPKDAKYVLEVWINASRMVLC